MRECRDFFLSFILVLGLLSLACMKVWDAIHEMRRLTEKNIPFSMAFMSYSEKRGDSNGIVEIERALLRKNTTELENRDILQEFTDQDTGENRRFYQPLLVFFNGIKLELS